MDRDAELTAYLLRYLYENAFFKTHREMADYFGMSTRQLQRLMNEAERCKGGTIALSKILSYFGSRKIPFDPILAEFFGQGQLEESAAEKAYMRLSIAMPDGLSSDGRLSFEYCQRFISLLSMHICPSCICWYEPWDGQEKLSHQNCFVAQTAKALEQFILDSETQRT